MGEEGVRLLDMREREIYDMRVHLKDALKVMEQGARAKTTSHIMIARPSHVTKSEPHLKPTSKPSKAKNIPMSTKKSTSRVVAAAKTRSKGRQ